MHGLDSPVKVIPHPKLKLFTVDAFVEITNLLVTRGNTQARGEGELKARSSATKVIGKQIWIIGKLA